MRNLDRMSEGASNSTKGAACEHDIELLHQKSGQCWNDASLVLLWFMSGAGEKVKKYLEQPDCLDDFHYWITSSLVREKILELFPDVLRTYDLFTIYIEYYVKCLQERYFLWKGIENVKKVKTMVQRTQSCTLSQCGEEFGFKSSEFLDQMPYSSVTGMKFYEGIGYNAKFTNILYLLLQFFLRGNLKLLIYHEDEAFAYGDILKTQTMPVLVHNPFDTTINNQFSNLESIKPIFELIPSHNISFTGTCIRIKDNARHAVSFLTCDGGETYFFDNNDGKLVKISWNLIFKDLSFKIASVLYIPTYAPKLDDFLGIKTEQIIRLINIRPVFIAYAAEAEELLIIIPGTNDIYIFDELNENEDYYRQYIKGVEKGTATDGEWSTKILKKGFSTVPEILLLDRVWNVFVDPGVNQSVQTTNMEFKFANKKNWMDEAILYTKRDNAKYKHNPFSGKYWENSNINSINSVKKNILESSHNNVKKLLLPTEGGRIKNQRTKKSVRKSKKLKVKRKTRNKKV